MEEQRFRALPVQLLASDDGVFIKRGLTEICIRGEGAFSALSIILGIASDHAASRDEILAHFAGADEEVVERLLNQLIERHFLIEERAIPRNTDQETSEELFYWHFAGTRSADQQAVLSQRRVDIIGVNHLSRQIGQSLQQSGMSPRFIDHPLLRSLDFFDRDEIDAQRWQLRTPSDIRIWECNCESSDCVIIAVENGCCNIIEAVNQLCIDKGVIFLPVILHDLRGYVGPLVVPKQSPCFFCLARRFDSNSMKPAESPFSSARTRFEQVRPSFHHSMVTVTGDIAAFEIVKFFGSIAEHSVGRLVEIDLLHQKVVSRSVLRLPRCPHCSPLSDISLTALKQSVFVID